MFTVISKAKREWTEKGDHLCPTYDSSVSRWCSVVIDNKIFKGFGLCKCKNLAKGLQAEKENRHMLRRPRWQRVYFRDMHNNEKRKKESLHKTFFFKTSPVGIEPFVFPSPSRFVSHTPTHTCSHRGVQAFMWWGPLGVLAGGEKWCWCGAYKAPQGRRTFDLLSDPVWLWGSCLI